MKDCGCERTFFSDGRTEGRTLTVSISPFNVVNIESRGVTGTDFSSRLVICVNLCQIWVSEIHLSLVNTKDLRTIQNHKLDFQGSIYSNLSMLHEEKNNNKNVYPGDSQLILFSFTSVAVLLDNDLVFTMFFE